MMTQDNQPCLVLLGTHRSGVSTLAGCLNLVGVNTGSASSDYTENQALVLTHDILMRDLGCDWDMVGELPRGWADTEAAKQAAQRLTGIIEERFMNRGSWAVVDPRMCRLMPLWEKVFESLDITPRLVLMIRHPMEVARSLEKNHDFDLNKGHLLWMVHYIEALKACRNHDRAIVAFDKLLADPVDVLRLIAKNLQVDYPVPLMDASRKVIEFIRPELKHHHARGSGEPAEDPYAHYAWVYKQLQLIQAREASPFAGGQEALEHKAVDICSLPGFPLVAPIQTEVGTELVGGHAVEIFNDLLSVVGRAEQRDRDLRLQKERLLLAASSSAETIFCQIFVPFSPSPKEAYSEEQSKKFLLPPDEWQEIKMDIPRPEALHTNSLRLDPLNTRGMAVIAAIKLMHAVTGDILWSAQDEKGFSECTMEGDGFIVSRGDNLILACTGGDPRLLLPVLPDLPDVPMELELWIKAGRKQTELQTRWADLTQSRRDKTKKLAALQAQLEQIQEETEEAKASARTELDKVRRQMAELEKTYEGEKSELQGKRTLSQEPAFPEDRGPSIPSGRE